MRILRINMLSLISLSLLTLFSIYACENPVTGNGGDGDDDEIDPQKPRDLTVTFDGTYVKLEWKATEEAEETGYEILRSGDLLDTVTNDVFTYVDDTFEKGNYYDYWVRTVYEGQPGLSADPVEIYTGYLWYIDYGNGIHKLDINSGEEVHWIPDVGGSSGLTWDGNYLWVSEIYYGKIKRIDPEDGEIVYSFSSPYGHPGGLAYDGEYLWCVDNDPWDGNYYIRYNHNTGTYAIYDKGITQGAVALTSDGDYLWAIEDFPYYRIVVIDLDTMEEVRGIPLPDRPDYDDFAYDGTYLWISFEGNLYKATTDGEIVDSILVDRDYIPGITFER
jgi:hypothetical protein